MEDLQIALNSSRVDQRNQGLWIRAWHVGQTLQALVVDKSPTMGTLLRVDGRQLVVPADLPAQKGAKLMLEVSQIMPAPTLKILQVNNPTAPIIHFAALSELSQKLTNQARSLIPRHGKIDKALLSLFGLRPEEFPQIRVNLIESLREIISSTGELTDGAKLAQALRQLGSFSGHSLSDVDLKRLLGELAQDCQSYPDETVVAELGETIAAALAKIALNQAGTLQAHEEGEGKYYLDLPLWFNGNLIVAELQLLAPSDIETERWQISCQFHIQNVGKFSAQVYLNAIGVSIALSASNDRFLALLQENLANLKQSLTATGLKVATVCCQSEEVSTSSVMDHFTNVLDERA